MSLVQRTACKCDVCGHEWLPEGAGTPERCPSRKCRASGWNNGKKVNADAVALARTGPKDADHLGAWGKNDLKSFPATTVLELDEREYPEDWEEPHADRIPEEEHRQPGYHHANGRKAAKGETLKSSLCRHGLYGATCPRCRYGSR